MIVLPPSYDVDPGFMQLRVEARSERSFRRQDAHSFFMFTSAPSLNSF